MPLAESGAAAAASSGREALAITKPWPGSLMFQPKLPLAKRANSIAFSTGSSAPIRSTLSAVRSSSLTTLSAIADSGPRT